MVHACAQACSADAQAFCGIAALAVLLLCWPTDFLLLTLCSQWSFRTLGSRFTWKAACGSVNTGETGPFECKGRGMEMGRPYIGGGQTQLQPVHGTTNPSPISRPSYLAAPDWPRLFWNSDFISGDLLRRAPVWLHGRPQVHQKTQNLIVETFLWCCPPLCKSKFTVRQLFQCL